MEPIHVQNVNIANIVTVIIQHSIVANVVQMNLKKDLLPVRTGISTACGTRLKMKCHKLMENTKNEHYPQIPCLVYGKLSTGTGYGVRYWNITEQCWDDEECDDYECSKDAIEEWAYLDDLIPNKKQ